MHFFLSQFRHNSKPLQIFKLNICVASQEYDRCRHNPSSLRQRPLQIFIFMTSQDHDDVITFLC